MFQNRVPHMLEGDYTPRSAVNIFVKDLGIVLDSARQAQFPLPLSSAAHQMFLMAAAAGPGAEDAAAVIKTSPPRDSPSAPDSGGVCASLPRHNSSSNLIIKFDTTRTTK